MATYVFEEDAPVILKGAKGASAQAIGEALEQIRVEAGGELRPEAVVDAARAEDHVLHRHFEWDNAAAAHQYRLAEARALIRIVRLEGETHEASRFAFISLNGGGGRSYRAVEDVERSATLQEAVLLRADADLAAWQKRYRELKDICSVVTMAREKIAAKRRRAASKQETRASA